MHSPAVERPRMPSGLLALAVGGFGIWLAEFLIAGLLPQVASMGLGYTAPLYVGAAMVLTAVAVMAVAARRAGSAVRQHRESSLRR